jgi:hypothetical protein
MIPGVYTYRTRIRSLKGAASYLWLEWATWLAMLWPVLGRVSLILVVAQYGFLAVYELSYFHNDRAATSGERPLRSPVPVPLRPGFIPTAVLVFVGCTLVIWGIQDADRALQFAGGSAAVVVLGVLHTEIGVRVGQGSPIRWLSFAWLAWMKYLPALLACVPWGSAAPLLANFFLLYGAGRVVEYAVEKHGGQQVSRLFDFNGVWFMIGLPVVLSSIPGGSTGNGILGAALFFGTHHVAAFGFRRYRR